MKYIKSFDSVEGYITYKENNTEKLPGLNRIVEENIITTDEKYPHSFVFLDDANHTNYNIIKYNSGAFDVEFNNVDIIVKKQLNPSERLTEDSVLITKNYTWNTLKTIPAGFVIGGNELNKICYLPDTIEVIKQGAFDGCSGLTSVKLPKNLKTIEDYAFVDCSRVNELIFTSKQCPNFSSIYNLFMCYPRITNLVLPYPYIDNYTKVINGVKWIYNDCGEPEITINDTNINIVSPVKVDTTGNDNIELSVDIIDDQNGESISSFNKLGGDYYAAIDARFNTTGIIDNLVNEECSEIINKYNSDVFQLPINMGKNKTYAMNITYLGKTVTKYITQPCYQRIIVETPSDYTGFNYVEIQNHPTSDNYNDEGDPFLEPYVLFSSKNQNKHNSGSSMKIKIDGFENFKLYIRSYAESLNDYIMVSQLDTNINNSTSYSQSSVKAHTRGKQQSGTDITSYIEVEFNNIDTSTEHYITVVFRKGGSVNYGTDTGYILIPNINLETVYLTPVTPITISYLDEGLTWSDNGEIEFIDGNKYRIFTSISQHRDATACKMRIDINDLSTFDFYIGSNSENGWDFVGVRLDNEISYNDIENNYGGTRSSWAEYSDYWYDTSVDYDEIDINYYDITQYKYIQFTNLNNTSHYIEIAYVKDSDGYSGEDVGFVVIPNKYQITINKLVSCPGDNSDCPAEWCEPDYDCFSPDDGDYNGDGIRDECPDTDGDGIHDYF